LGSRKEGDRYEGSAVKRAIILWSPRTTARVERSIGQTRYNSAATRP